MALVPTQAMLLLPGLFPTLIEQREPQCQHRIDVLRFPMYAWSFETGLYQELMATLQPTRPQVGRLESSSERAVSVHRSPAPGSAGSVWLSGSRDAVGALAPHV